MTPDAARRPCARSPSASILDGGSAGVAFPNSDSFVATWRSGLESREGFVFCDLFALASE